MSSGTTKKGSVCVIDDELLEAVRYALEAKGSTRLENSAGARNRRHSLNEPGAGGDGGDGGGDGAVPAAITGGSSAAGYSVDLYADGYGKPKTGSGTLYLTEVAYNSDLPSGARVLAHPCLVETTAGDAT